MPPIPSTIINLPRMKFNRVEQNDEELTFHMEPDLRYNPRCSKCCSIVSPNRNLNRRIRDLGSFGNVVYVDFKYREILCKSCGKVVEKLDFVEPYARITTRLAEAVGKLCEHMSISEVAEYFGLNWKTVKEIDKHYIKKKLKEIPLDNVKVIGMDEVARKKGHKYFTLIYDLETNRLLRIIKGRTQEAVSEFFEELGEQCNNIKAVAIDMWKPFINVVSKYCSKALIVFDKFHVISNYHKLIDKIRRKEFKKASQEDKELLKGKRYLLLKNRDKLKPDSKEKLKQLLKHNETLNIVYALKEQLQAIWSNSTVASFNNALDEWCEMARKSEINELSKFADSLQNHRAGLWSYCLYPINTSLIEAHNNTIGFVKRQARGFHDEEYFKLKIFQAINLKNSK